MDTVTQVRSVTASTGNPQGDGAGLTCYVYPQWQPRIRPASARRDWMDATPESFAYRCLPLNIANAHGWEILSPCGFEAEWNGGAAVDDVVVRVDPGAEPHHAPVALFGSGVLTFHVEGLLRTSPGINVWVGSPPNAMKDGLAPLSGVIETDWSPFTFTMNWRFTRPNQVIRFEENEPFCFFFPVDRQMIQQARPRIAPIDEAPELKAQFETWSTSRDRFHADMAAGAGQSPTEKWQKFYYRGVDAEGVPGADDHCAKLRLSEFEGAERFQKTGCPAHKKAERAVAHPLQGKAEWIIETLDTLRNLAPEPLIARKKRISREAFLQDHYAVNRPLVLTGEIADWPALRLWTAEYLKRRIGAQPVEVQVRRNADPDFERRMDAHSEVMSFDAFIDLVQQPGSGNDAYMTAYNSARNETALSALHDDLGFIDSLLTRDSRGMIWIGPAGTFTPLHHDLTNNLLLQLQGRKQILLVSPLDTMHLYNDHHVYSQIRDLREAGLTDRFPKIDGLRVHQVILEPGEALFIPVGWWHQVAALDFSVTITHTNFRWPNEFHNSHPKHARSLVDKAMDKYP